MILTTHILTGAALTTQAPNPAIGLALAYLSHYVLDAIPHAEYDVEALKKVKTEGWGPVKMPAIKIATDLIVAFGILFLASVPADLPLHILLLGGIFGALPDGLSLLGLLIPEKLNIAKPEHRLHMALHYKKHKKYTPAVTWGVQITIIMGALAALFIIR